MSGFLALPLLAGPRSAAGAEPAGTEIAFAETLYRQARELMSQGKYDEACPKFRESYRLDPATGTLLNLAACHERQGKLATAWLEYSDAVGAARRDGRPDRVKFADDRIRALEPQLSRITLTVPAEADTAELEIRLDGALMGPAARGVPTPVDPGRHRVEAKAPQKLPWSREIEVGRLGDQQTVTIPKLLDAPASAVTTGGAGNANSLHTTLGTGEPASRDALAKSRPTPVSVYVVGITTVALGVAGSITGAVYLHDRSAFISASGSTDPQRRASAEHYQEVARNVGYVNAALLGATAGGAALAAYLYVTRPEGKPKDPSAAQLLPYAGPTCAGISISGAL